MAVAPERKRPNGNGSEKGRGERVCKDSHGSGGKSRDHLEPRERERERERER